MYNDVQFAHWIANPKVKVAVMRVLRLWVSMMRVHALEVCPLIDRPQSRSKTPFDCLLNCFTTSKYCLGAWPCSRASIAFTSVCCYWLSKCTKCATA